MHGLNYCKGCDPWRVGVTQADSEKMLAKLSDCLRAFERAERRLSGFLTEWLRWSRDPVNSAAFYQLHRMGAVQLAPSGVKEDPGNKSYLLAMRLCFPKPTAESGIKDAEKLGNVMESMYGYAEMFGREDHFFFCMLTEVLRCIRELSPLLPKTHVVQQSVFNWEDFESLVRAGAAAWAAKPSS